MNGLYDELRVALHGIWTRRWLALAVAWGVCLVGWVVVATIPNTYESRARLLVDINNILPDASGVSPYADRRQIDEIRQTLTSARNLEKVAITTGLVPAGSTERDRTDAVAMLQKSIRVVPQQDNIFELVSAISVSGLSDAENAKLASGVVDSLITVFRDEQLRGGRASSRQGIRFLDSQLAERQTALREAEARRAAFEAQNIGVIPGAGGGAGFRIDTARSELAQVEAQIAAAQGALSAAQSQLAATPSSITVPGLASAGGGVARQQLAGAQAELSAMRARGLTDAHPDVIALRSQIGSLQAQAAREPTGGTAASTTQNPAYAQLVAMRAERAATLSALQQRRGQLQAEVAAATARQLQAPGATAEYERLNSDYTVLKDQYDRLLAQREQLKLRGDVETETDTVRVELIDPPSRPRSPVSPNRPLLLTLVLLAGLGAGIAAAFFATQVQSTYATADRLARASGLPVLGSITEVLTPARSLLRRRKLVWLAGGSGALVAMFLILLTVEYVQRGMVA